jgi:hypothetical protein
VRKRHQCHAIDLGPERCRIVPLEAFFEMRNALKCCVPACFKFARNEPLGRVDDLVSARRN